MKKQKTKKKYGVTVIQTLETMSKSFTFEVCTSCTRQLAKTADLVNEKQEILRKNAGLPFLWPGQDRLKNLWQ